MKVRLLSRVLNVTLGHAVIAADSHHRHVRNAAHRARLVSAADGLGKIWSVAHA